MESFIKKDARSPKQTIDMSQEAGNVGAIKMEELIIINYYSQLVRLKLWSYGLAPIWKFG